MPTSGTCLSRRCRARGFTLLELMVVLTLMGLAISIVAPNLSRLYASVTRSTERDYILDQLAAVAHRAWIRETNLVVYGTALELSNEDARSDGDAFANSQSPGSGQMLLAARYGDYEVHVVDVPEGWVLRLEGPLRARANGVCLGAAVTLTHRSGTSYRATLEPPFCHV